MTDHTPGPWDIVFNDDVERIRLNGSTVYQVADTTDPDFPTGKPRYNLADLRLMAAAPELLKACRLVAACLGDWIEVADRDSDTSEDERRLAVAWSAINKAEGRSVR